VSTSFFFHLLLEGHDLGLGAGLVDLGGTLVAQFTLLEQAPIGSQTLIGEAIVTFKQAGYIGHAPERALAHTALSSQQLGGAILMQLVHQALDLLRREPGAVAAPAMIEQGAEAPLLVGACPVQEATGATGADIGKLGNGMAQSIKAHGLIARLGCGVLAVDKGGLQFSGLLLRQTKAASSHTYLIRNFHLICL
jgi:hypothetical protein